MGGSNPFPGSRVAVGGKVDYFCRFGHRINGAPSAICLATGKFSKPVPKCVEGKYSFKCSI